MTQLIDDRLKNAIEQCFMDPEVRERSYYPEFRRGWMKVFGQIGESCEPYFDFSSPACFCVACEFPGFDLTFHFDQLKIYEWYEKELRRRKKVVFFSKKLKRDRKTGQLMFHEAVCRCTPDAEEKLLEENMRNIIACALPQTSLTMEIIYGNKWVERRINPLRRNTLDIFLIGTDYVPAFLGSPLEMAVYLFLMDICIIKENLGKAKDEDIKGLLHIMRPSPMLRIRGLA